MLPGCSAEFNFDGCDQNLIPNRRIEASVTWPSQCRWVDRVLHKISTCEVEDKIRRKSARLWDAIRKLCAPYFCVKPDVIFPGTRSLNSELKYGVQGKGASQHWSPFTGT